MKILMTAFIAFCSLQLFAQSFEPGMWKSKESLELNGIKLPESGGEECIAEDQAKDAKATIDKELKKQGCSLTKWAVKNQKLNAAIICKNENMDAVGNLEGEFTRKSYNLKGQAKGSIRQMLPATAELKLAGSWVKACVQSGKD